MSDAADRGITVTEIAALDRIIDVSPETTAAFVGRALRGPLNTPVLVRSFGEYLRRFGEVWLHSSLGPTVRQFFDHGGQRLYIVRVANSARGAMICLPASGSALVLRAVEPGSTELVRAAVDYDGIDDDNDTLFNLTLQRVNPETGLVEDQELFKRLSYVKDDAQFVADALLSSTLARVDLPYPTHRPEATMGTRGLFLSSYVEPAQPGTDGKALSDYDLIGSRKHRTGLFALEQVEGFDLLYLPPPAKGVDVGPAAVLAAELYCRERRAMLVVDPRREWTSPDDAVRGVRELGYASPNMLSYFPRIRKRSGDDGIPRPAGGAIAGLLCKQDRVYGPWQSLDQQGMGLHRTLNPVIAIDEEDAAALNRAGLNVIMQGPAGRARVRGSVTMGRGSESERKFASLPVRRFCLQVVSAIAQAARWAVFEKPDPVLAARIRAQISHYFAGLAEVGAFADDRYVVECDVGLPEGQDAVPRAVTIVLVFHPVGCDDPVSLKLNVTAAGCRVSTTAFAPTMAGSAGDSSQPD